MSHTTVIAEIGSAWRFGERQLENAYSAIRLAKSCGADVIKFQWTSNPRKMEQRRNVPAGSYNILAWPQDWLPNMASAARTAGIEFLCTVFLPEDVAIMNPYVQRWKVASLENQSKDLFEVMIATRKEIISSFGATAPIEEEYGHKMLHCTAAYPAMPESLNLLAIKCFNYSGYSDHSRDVLTGAIAVACGARIIEIHFKLNSTPLDNPDFPHSLWTHELVEYIRNIRKAELMLGDGVKKVEKCEEWALKHKVRA